MKTPFLRIMHHHFTTLIIDVAADHETYSHCRSRSFTAEVYFVGDWEINISKYKIGKINNSNEESPVKAGGGWWQMCFAAANC